MDGIEVTKVPTSDPINELDRHESDLIIRIVDNVEVGTLGLR